MLHLLSTNNWKGLLQNFASQAHKILLALKIDCLVDTEHVKGNKNAIKQALHLYLDLLVFYQPIS